MSARRTRNAFVVLEGGGAKGLGHIGALQALIEQGYAPAGIAGTSAGAIVAMLSAVGLAPADIYDPATGGNVLARQHPPLTPIGLLGPFRWRLFNALTTYPALALFAVALVVMLLGALGVGIPPWLRWPATAVSFVPIALFSWVGWHRGYFDGTAMRDTLNTVLRARLADCGITPPPLVRFRDIAPGTGDGFISLKVIAADVTTRMAVQFDRQRTPDVVVADAVAASASIPIVFRPARIRQVTASGTAEFMPGALFCDGGLVANLPVWVFEAERRAIARTAPDSSLPPVIAFTLGDVGVTRAGLGPGWRGLFPYLAAVARTAVFGGQAFARGLAADPTPVDLPLSIGVLDFDLTRTQATAAFAQGHAAALAQLTALARNAAPVQRLLDEVLADAAAQLPALPGRLRASLVAPGDDGDFRVTASANMAADADDQLHLDPRNPVAPAAYAGRIAVFADLQVPAAAPLFMTKYEHALLARDLCSVIAVPVIGSDDAATGVLCLDSSASLAAAFADPAFMTWLGSRAADFDPVRIERLAHAQPA